MTFKIRDMDPIEKIVPMNEDPEHVESVEQFKRLYTSLKWFVERGVTVTWKASKGVLNITLEPSKAESDL